MFLFDEMCDQGNGLYGFAQTHLISENAIEVVVVKRHQPLETFKLWKENVTWKENVMTEVKQHGQNGF